MTDWTTLLVPEYVVWVNSDGEVVSTETRAGSATPATPAPVVASSSSSTTVAVSTESLPLVSSTIPPAPSYTASPPNRDGPSNTAAPAELEPSTTPAPISSEPAPPPPQPIPITSSTSSLAAPSPESEESGAGLIYGLAYDILKGNPGQCKTPDEVSAEIAYFKSNRFTHIRIYDVDCNQVNMVTSAAAANGLKVIISISNLATLSDSLRLLISEAGSNLDTIDTVAIGNEHVNGGGAVEDVVSALGYARSYLASHGFTGSIVTVDTCNAILANPTLCGEASDYVAANCHAFFDPNVSSSGAGAWVAGQASELAKACGGKRVVITESGWPWQGQANNLAVPSISDQQAALKSLNAAFQTDEIVLFQAFDTPYKQLGAFGVEPYFGISYLTGGQAS